MKIQTERLVLRPFTIEDASEYYSLVSTSQSIKRFVPYAVTSSVDEMKSTIEKSYSKGNFKDDFYFVIEEKSSKKIIGAIIAIRIVKGELNVSYLVGEDFRHKGYMYEAMTAFISELKQTTIKHLSFEIETRNLYSRDLVKKLKAKCIGFDLGKVDKLYYSLEV